MRKIFLPLFIVLVVCLTFGTALAGPSSKNSVDAKGTQLLGTELNKWTKILEATLHTSEQKDLVVDVSLECGLETFTRVKSKGSDRNTSTAMAGIEIAVVLDGEFYDGGEYEFWTLGTGTPAFPGNVTYAKRTQQLSASFAGAYDTDSCVDYDENGVITLDECSLTDEEISLMLNTMSANAFNFILLEPGTGDHTLTVMARVNKVGEDCPAGYDWIYEDGIPMCTNGNEPPDLIEPDNADASATAWIGKGSLSVDEVRFVKGMQFEEGSNEIK